MSRYDFNAPRLFIDAPLAHGGEVALTREQSNYLVNVLRLTEGAGVLVFNGRDGEWQARLHAITKKTAALKLEQMRRAQEIGPDIQYVFAPLKHARLDYIVQKAVEMGVNRLTPCLTARTQTHRVNLDRMRANAIEAAEQCGILALPEIDEPIAFDKFVAGLAVEKLLVFCDEDARVGDPFAALTARKSAGVVSIAVLIGPEGGFDERERRALQNSQQTLAISLGPRILRADTAGVAALALVQAVLGDWQ